MFELSVNENNEVFLWSAEDWRKLRTEHRIVGNLIGSLASLPRQNNILGLPVMLLPEETTLLLELNLAKVVKHQSLSSPPSADDIKMFNEYREKSQKEQAELFIEKRKAQVIEMIDQIVKGKELQQERLLKRKKTQFCNGVDDSQVPFKIRKEEILKNELDKVVAPPASNYLIQIFTADPWIKPETSIPVDWSYPSSMMEKLRFLTFKNLWEKGFYMTSGTKFGGDFLAYPGDPMKFHAHLIVICLDSTEEISLQQLVAYGRLGSSTKKRIVLSRFGKNEDSVKYQTLKWKDRM